MEPTQAIDALAALAQETRLGAFRLLVRAGAEGMAAGAIARQLVVPHNTLSIHLAALVRAGLITSHRESRSVIYAAHIEGARELLDFLLRDCCGGQPELCTPLLDAAMSMMGCLNPGICPSCWPCSVVTAWRRGSSNI